MEAKLMEGTVLNEKQAQAVVDGLLNGYKEYLELRREMRNRLKVSAAFAFTRGNFIDDGIAKNVSDFMEYKKKTAGQSWQYLEFTLNKSKPSLLIIKNDFRLQQTFSKNKQEKTSQYLSDYAKINEEKLDSIYKGERELTNSFVQLALPLAEDAISEKDLTQYDSFYIIVYRTSAEKVIESVSLVLPDDEIKELHEIQNLSSYLQSSTVNIEEDEYSAVVGDEEIVAGNLYDYPYTVPKEEKEASDE